MPAAYFTLLCEPDEGQSARQGRRAAISRRWPRSASCRARISTRASSMPDFAKRGFPQGRLRQDHAAVQGQQGTSRTNGWGFTTKTGIYGTDYFMRASSPPSASAPTGRRTRSTRPRRSRRRRQAYNGANKYVMHFAKGQTPPADGFWSLTMYDGAYFFVDNPLNRYTISARAES